MGVICGIMLSTLRLCKAILAWATVFCMGVLAGSMVLSALVLQPGPSCVENAGANSTWALLGHQFSKAWTTGEHTVSHVSKIADLAAFLMGEGAYLVTAPMLFSQLCRWSSFTRMFWRPGRRNQRPY